MYKTRTRAWSQTIQRPKNSVCHST